MVLLHDVFNNLRNSICLPPDIYDENFFAYDNSVHALKYILFHTSARTTHSGEHVQVYESVDAPDPDEVRLEIKIDC